MIILRPAALADAEALAAMNKQLIEDEQHDNPMTMPQLKERMEGFLSGDYIALLCADEKDNTLGYALVHKAAQPAYLRQFFICREQRRKGVGRQFFWGLLEYLRTDTIDVEVMAWNEAGKAFWESLRCRPRSIYLRYERGQ
ncbi:MAG: GNAT family N-acetyltransferase [Firmicutes bacterium]|nr:GNAT family N-acetyltransferase [Bacillota bacterium]